MIVSPGSALPSRLLPVAVSAPVIVAVTGPGTGGANGSGAGSGCGPGSAGAGIAVGGFTNSSSSVDLALLGLVASLLAGERELFLTVGLLPIPGAATAAIGVIRIVKESKQATKTLRLPGEG